MQDSENQLAALLGQDPVGRSGLVEQAQGGYLALRSGPFKFIPGSKPRLYNLSTDIAEQRNLAPKMPGKVEEMQKLLEKIKAEGVAN